MIATGGDVGLAKGIIDDTYLVFIITCKIRFLPVVLWTIMSHLFGGVSMLYFLVTGRTIFVSFGTLAYFPKNLKLSLADILWPLWIPDSLKILQKPYKQEKNFFLENFK